MVCKRFRSSTFSIGFKHGLQLVVNIENYQHTKGPHYTVGLKLLLHGQNDLPSVQDFGDNIPVGMNTFVAVGLSKVSIMMIEQDLTILYCHPRNTLEGSRQGRYWLIECLLIQF